MQIKVFNPLVFYTVRVFFLFPCFLAIWWYALPVVILPYIEYTAGWGIEQLFQRENVEISTNQALQWLIDTYFLIEETPYRRTWSTVLDIKIYSFGLPLFWCVCMAFFPLIAWRKLFLGSCAILGCISICVFFKAWATLAALVMTQGIKNIYITSGVYEAVISYPSYTIQIIDFIGIFFAYMAMIIIPFSIAYFINRPAIRAILLCILLSDKVKRYKVK